MNIPKEDWPRLHWLVDPVDYIKPIIYGIGNPAWNNPEKSGILAGFCPPTDTIEQIEITLD
ncbi:MAG: hypothetical protein KUG69_09660 [Marinosulfonomonas sp.]|nr:hypothetical protein [Marinosulfonomonas sp.]